MASPRASFTSILADDTRGVTMVEFALIAPVLVLLLMGMFDLGHSQYARSVLEGEMQAAGRASTFETSTVVANQAAIDAQVASQIRRIAGKSATVTFSRKAVQSYKRMQLRAEEFLDGNGNNVCDNGETFEDSNGNGTWSPDATIAGQGGAKDVQLYDATVTYPRMFPMASLLGWSQNQTVKASTVLRNQPYTNQAVIPKGTCA
jgi:Flp pilus assembly protein TadG